MRCEVCGRVLREVRGVYFVDGKWLLLNAGYCFRHGSFLSKTNLDNAEEVIPNPTLKEHIRPGLHVHINVWENQAIQLPVDGFVKSILSAADQHKDGIRVMLSSGKVGRIIKILE